MTWVRLVRWIWPVWLAQYRQSLYQSRSKDRMPSPVANRWVVVVSPPLNSSMLMLVIVAYMNLGSMVRVRVKIPLKMLSFFLSDRRTKEINAMMERDMKINVKEKLRC